MPSFTRLLALGLFLSPLVVTGCRRSISPDTAESTQYDPAPSDFKMMLGQGGGFAGRWTGFTIESDGSIVEWSGPVAGSNEHPAGTLGREGAAAIWHDVVKIDFFSQEIDERGEVTAFLTINADSVEHRVSWIPGVEGLEPPKHPVEALLWRTRKIAMAAKAAVDDPVTN